MVLVDKPTRSGRALYSLIAPPVGLWVHKVAFLVLSRELISVQINWRLNN